MSDAIWPVHWAGERVTLVLPNEIDISNADRLSTELIKLLDAGASAVVVDMSRTTFCDSAGVSALVIAHRRAAGRKAEIRIAAALPPIQRIFELTGLDQLIDSYPGLDQAEADPDRGRDGSDPDLAQGIA